MKFFLINLILITIISITASETSAQTEWQRKYRDQKEVKSMFAEPPMFYAPHAFWFWDDTIRDEKFPASMAQEMIAQRLNPGYAHPRSSMERLNSKYPSLPYDQYLGKPWFNSFGNAMQKAKDNGLTLGYCDEYDWPSGQAAGRVLNQHPELEAKYLDWKRYEVKGKLTIHYDSIDFAVAGRMINKKMDAATLKVIGEGKNMQWTAPAGDWVVYTYTKKFHGGFDGGKVNCLDPKLMQVFIPMVHEQYAKHFGNDMGKTIPGVFVDNEGDYGWQMAWSEHLAERYKAIKKQDIRIWLPLLTEKDKDGLFVKARCDWFDVISDVYNECYFEPMVSWLKKHNMYYISNLWEESLKFQAVAMGDFMRITRTATMPGTDCLLMKSQDVHDFKEVQSVAEFEDRPFMSEIMGVAGWEQTPEMMKMTVNSITAFGVNHIVPHGIYVNRKLETVPFPPDWFTENPYWPYLHYWTDFSRRSSFITRQSKLVADVLLINPLESIWALAEGMFSSPEGYTVSEDAKVWDKRSVETDQVYSDAMREMNTNNIDFLVADKYYLSRGRIDAANNAAKITINNHQFSALVLPPACVISHVASGKILEFAKKGGVVVLLGEVPQGSPEIGMKDPLIISQMKALQQLPNVINLSADKNRLGKMVAVLNEKIKPQIVLENAGRLYTAHRKIGDDDLYWLANNTDTVRYFSAWLREGDGAAEIWDCETGGIKAVASTKDKGYNKLSLTLQPYEGYWIAFSHGEKKQMDAIPYDKSVKEMLLNEKWTVSYPADTIYRTSAKAFFSEDKIIQEDKMRSDLIDTGWKYNSFIAVSLEKALQQLQKQNADNKKNVVSYVYWRVKVPVGSSKLLLPENMLGASIWIDGEKKVVTGNPIDLNNGAHLLSFAFIPGDKKIPSSPFKFFKPNKTEQSLESWYNYGLEQYTGYVDYETMIPVNDDANKVFLDLGETKFMAEVFVNDISVGARLWPPFRFNLTGELKKGNNKIRVRIGNLMVNQMWMKDDLNELRSWGWIGAPDFERYNAGFKGPVKLVITK